jgi:hypothetical protein
VGSTMTNVFDLVMGDATWCGGWMVSDMFLRNYGWVL